MRKEVLLFAALALAGCGTVTRGASEDVVIQVAPAGAKVTTSLGQSCAGSCVVSAPRNKTFTVTAEAPGHVPQTVNVGLRQMENAGATQAGSFMAGGLVGMGIDAAAGGTNDHFPNPVVIILQPAG